MDLTLTRRQRDLIRLLHAGGRIQVNYPGPQILIMPPQGKPRRLTVATLDALRPYLTLIQGDQFAQEYTARSDLLIP